MSHNTLNGFQNPSQTTESENLFRFLDAADAMAFVQDCKQKMLALGPVQSGDHVLDVGCGLGHEVIRLAQTVGENGRVVGIDQNPMMIAEAQRRAADIAYPLEFQVGDGHRLNFETESFDLCRAERVIEYVKNPQQMLAEMVRVVRPGGAVVIFDFDYDGVVVAGGDRDLMRRMKQPIFDSVPHGGIGSQLPHLYRQVGLQEIQVVPHAFTPSYFVYERLARGPLEQALQSGIISQTEFESWWQAVEQANQEGRFFSAYLGFVVSGRKPVIGA